MRLSKEVEYNNKIIETKLPVDPLFEALVQRERLSQVVDCCVARKIYERPEKMRTFSDSSWPELGNPYVPDTANISKIIISNDDIPDTAEVDPLRPWLAIPDWKDGDPIPKTLLAQLDEVDRKIAKLRGISLGLEKPGVIGMCRATLNLPRNIVKIKETYHRNEDLLPLEEFTTSLFKSDVRKPLDIEVDYLEMSACAWITIRVGFWGGRAKIRAIVKAFESNPLFVSHFVQRNGWWNGYTIIGHFFNTAAAYACAKSIIR